MRKISLLGALLLVAATLPASASHRDGQPPAPVLRGADCLDPYMARGFTDLDRNRLLVDAGRRRYLIEVYGSCWNINHATLLVFRGDPIANRVCGTAFDAVIPNGGHPCRIERMELLSKDEYKALLQQKEELRRARRADRQARKRG
jgi:hypothetical protein